MGQGPNLGQLLRWTAKIGPIHVVNLGNLGIAYNNLGCIIYRICVHYDDFNATPFGTAWYNGSTGMSLLGLGLYVGPVLCYCNSLGEGCHAVTNDNHTEEAAIPRTSRGCQLYQIITVMHVKLRDSCECIKYIY